MFRYDKPLLSMVKTGDDMLPYICGNKSVYFT